MKPRNKFQKQVAELAIQLPTITDKQSQWAYTHLFEHIAKRNTKGEHTCLECGHQWTDTRHKGKTTICPIAERNSPYIQNVRGYLEILHTIAYLPPSKATK